MINNLLKKFKRQVKLSILYVKYLNLSTEQIFSKIYKENTWEKNSTDYNSGPGSHKEYLVSPYLKFVNTFIKEKKINSIVDLGCGDFNIGKNIFQQTNIYYAIDIVPELIEFNKIKYQNKKIFFECKNFIEDTFVHADCVIIRQVLQHLDNKSIIKVLNKIQKFKHIIITEHIPITIFNPNIDKKTGPTTRLEYNSGVNIELEPFNFNFVYKKEINISDKELGGIHKTTIYTTR